MACGIVDEGEEPITRSFKDWHAPFPDQPNRSHIMVVEQDNEEQMQQMVLKVQRMASIKDYIKKGFIDKEELESIFEKNETKKGLAKYNRYVYWTYTLTAVLDDSI